jgi:TRAP-type C4-dicarboxylate transport system permease small subunit
MADASPAWDRVAQAYLSASRVAILSAALVMFVIMVAANAFNMTVRTLSLGDVLWHQEISILAAMWVYFAAYALIGKEDAYIRVEFLVDLLPRRINRTIQILVRVVTIAFQVAVVVLTWRALKVVSVFQTHILEWPEYFFYIPLLVAGVDIALTECIHLARALAGRSHERLSPRNLIGTGS